MKLIINCILLLSPRIIFCPPRGALYCGSDGWTCLRYTVHYVYTHTHTITLDASVPCCVCVYVVYDNSSGRSAGHRVRARVWRGAKAHRRTWWGLPDRCVTGSATHTVGYGPLGRGRGYKTIIFGGLEKFISLDLIHFFILNFKCFEKKNYNGMRLFLARRFQSTFRWSLRFVEIRINLSHVK